MRAAPTPSIPLHPPPSVPFPLSPSIPLHPQGLGEDMWYVLSGLPVCGIETHFFFLQEGHWLSLLSSRSLLPSSWLCLQTLPPSDAADRTSLQPGAISSQLYTQLLAPNTCQALVGPLYGCILTPAHRPHFQACPGLSPGRGGRDQLPGNSWRRHDI